MAGAGAVTSEMVAVTHPLNWQFLNNQRKATAMNTPTAAPNPKIVIDRLEGNIMALEAIVRALILSAPNQQSVASAAKAQLEYLRTAALPSKFSDDVLAGIDATENVVLRQ